MYLPIVTWLILGASALSFMHILRCAYTRARGPKFNPNDVVHFVYPVDWPLLQSLLDPAADFALRWSLSPRALREEQRRRMHMYRELLRRMSHNSMVLADFDDVVMGNYRLAGEPDSKLREAIIKVRIYCNCARVRLSVWLLLPDALGLIPAPDLSRLRKAAAVDGPEAYDELRTAAAEAFARLRPDELEALSRSL